MRGRADLTEQCYSLVTGDSSPGVGVYDVLSDRFEEVWSSSEITTGGRYIKVSGIGAGGDCAIRLITRVTRFGAAVSIAPHT